MQDTSGGSSTARRALVVEDQKVFREMLVEFLRTTGMEVVGQLGGARDAVEFLSSTAADLVVIDLMLEDGMCLDLIDHVHALRPAPEVLVVTAKETPAIMREVVRRRPLGIVTKSASLRELREAVARTSAGRGFYCESTLRLLRASPPPEEVPTGREQEVLTLVAKGFSSREIAELLGISPKTVSNHRLRIGRKLGVSDIAGWTRYALAQGWVSEDE